MAAFNCCVFVGNLTRDVELTFTPNQTPVANFGLAVNRKWTGSDGAKHEEVCFIDVTAFAKLAEVVNKYMHKGSSMLVQGHLAFEQWEKDGNKHSRHRLIAESVQFLPDGKAREGSGSAPGAIPDSDIPF